VVKADACGVGPVGRMLRDADARSFFVAPAEEGVALREAVGSGPAVPVLDGAMAGDEGQFRGTA
jgi:alanine racemase